tara:strand:+ start:538 stop:1398 length:861 start_codon:yes stop_codon:yes gene_type:complete
MAYLNEYGSGINLNSMVVPVRAATVYAAQENSLYLPGLIVPNINVPAGSASAQVPLMGSVTATTVSAAGGETDPGVDFASVLPTNTAKTIALDLHAARSVLRDLGGIDTADMGRIMGNAIAKAVDKAVTTQFATFTGQEIGGAGTLTVDEIFSAVATIRGNGETGQLYGIVGTNSYAALMAVIGSAAFAGGEFQNTAMRNGFFGTLAGVQLYVSSYLNDTDMGTTGKNPQAAIFSADAVKMASQGGVNIEVARRPEAVGFDVVASMAMGALMIDATRGVIIENDTP